MEATLRIVGCYRYAAVSLFFQYVETTHFFSE